MQDTALIIFAKYPEPGKVKTRLAKGSTAEFATKLYENMISDVILNSFQDLTQISQKIFVPKEDQEKFQKKYNVKTHPQVGATLGEKIFSAFKTIKAQKAIIIGTDSPDLPPEILIQAEEALNTHDTCIGPTPDGGYYLYAITTRSLSPTLFENINWSTETVFKESLEKIKNQGLSVKILPKWPDIDHFSDVIDLLNRAGDGFKKSNTIHYIKKTINDEDSKWNAWKSP